MTRRTKTAAAIALVACGGLTALLAINKGNGVAAIDFMHLPKAVVVSFYAYELEPYLKDGDILCRMGDRFWSLYFRDISPGDKRFSHLGIVRIQEGICTVLNAEGTAWEGTDFVNEISLQDFLNSAKTVGIYRANFIDGKTISDTALTMKGIPFDWKFDLETPDRLYCTELLYAVLQHLVCDVSLKRAYQKELQKEIIPLEAVSDSFDFTEIAYLTK